MTTDENKRIDHITATINELLNGRIPEQIELNDQPDDEICRLSRSVNKLVEQETNLKETTLHLSQGNLKESFTSRLPSAHSLKNLQASLRHLTRQTKQIAKGDFSQRTDFLGEFSDAFNWMVESLRDYRKNVKQEAADRKMAELIAESASKSKSEFLASMSHELRTPLNHILGFTQIVVDGGGGVLNDQQEDFLNDVLTSSNHLLNLINDILDLSKVEAGKTELEPTDIDLRMVLENSLIMFKEKTLKHGIELSTEINGIPDTVSADERKLKQIVYNLLSNAVKFTPDGGSIVLSARSLEFSNGTTVTNSSKTISLPTSNNHRIEGGRNYIEISVRDSGAGIKPEDMEHIFDPFDQAKNQQSGRHRGTGLGLSLVNNFVQLHGGTVWAESEGEGKGSIFSFTIPA